jgi:hypothetical protein
MAVPDFADAHPGYGAINYGTIKLGRHAARRRSAAMGKSKENLSPQEWQARHDAACAIVARKYCDMFKFWRTCRYKPCRSARRCRGDQGVCLESRWDSVPYEAGIAAQIRMAAETPPNADRFTRAAHYYTPCSLCLHKSEKSADPRPD